MAVELNQRTFDPMLVKPKCICKAVVLLKNCKQTAENCKQTAENQNNCTPLKRLLALPKWGQKCIVLELQSVKRAILIWITLYL